MNRKVTLLAAIIILSISSILNVHAQRNVNSMFRSNLQTGFMQSNKLTLMASLGLSAVNSDNGWRGYESDMGMLKANGRGPNISIGVIYQVSPFIGVSGNIENFKLKGFEDEGVNKSNQSVSFQTNATSVSGAVLIQIAKKRTLTELYSHSTPNRLIIVPYITVGAGLMHYSVSSSSTSSDAELEGTDYPNLAAVFPVGGGIKFRCSDKISIAPEFTFNFTSTDHLDNQPEIGGYTGKNDQFVTTSVKVLYTPTFRRRR